MTTIDINCDMGEGFGAYEMGNDDAMLEIVSSVNLACGFHAGDPVIMHRICAQAAGRGVAVGAHPGYPDLWGFGRRNMPFARDDLQTFIAYQIGASQAMARLAGHRVTHIKPHGALGHHVADNEDAATMLIELVERLDPKIILYAMSGTLLERLARERGLRVASEIFADRSYMDNGRLTPRGQPGAVIHDGALTAERMRRMIGEGAIITESGKRIPTPIDTICVHGDTPNAAQIAQGVREALEASGIRIAPLVSVQS